KAAKGVTRRGAAPLSQTVRRDPESQAQRRLGNARVGMSLSLWRQQISPPQRKIARAPDRDTSEPNRGRGPAASMPEVQNLQSLPKKLPPFTEAIGNYSAHDLNEAALTVFGE